MIRSIAAYVLAPVIIPIVMSIAALPLTLVAVPLGKLLGASVGLALTNLIACFVAVISMFWVCKWLDTPIRLGLFVIPILLVLGNELNYMESRKTGVGPLFASILGCLLGIGYMWPMAIV